jgi:Glutaredoxin-like domain (DUF836)
MPAGVPDNAGRLEASDALEFRSMDELYLYTRAGCHLCEETRTALVQLLAERTAAGLSSPTLVERDIDTNEDWQRAFMTTIPVVELRGRRLELALSSARIRRLLTETLDASPAAAGG